MFFFFKLEILKNLNFKIYVILSKKRNRKKFIFKIMDKNNKNNNNANSSHQEHQIDYGQYENHGSESL